MGVHHTRHTCTHRRASQYTQVCITPHTCTHGCASHIYTGVHHIHVHTGVHHIHVHTGVRHTPHTCTHTGVHHTIHTQACITHTQVCITHHTCACRCASQTTHTNAHTCIGAGVHTTRVHTRAPTWQLYGLRDGERQHVWGWSRVVNAVLRPPAVLGTRLLPSPAARLPLPCPEPLAAPPFSLWL